MPVITGLFPVVGFALMLMGLLEILRATGVVNRSSPFFRYRTRVGGLLVYVGAIILVLSIVL